MTSIQWWRSWHGAPMDNKWPVIAIRAGVKVGVVSAIAWALMDYASQHKERGSIDGFDTEVYAVYSGFSEDEIKAVIKAMEDKGIIYENHLTNWEKRQPQREDNSSDRVAQWRETKRIVTQCNANDEDVTQSNPQRRGDKDKDKEEEENDASPFEQIKSHIEQLTGVPAVQQSIKAIDEIVEMGASPGDITAGYEWLRDVNKTFKYYGQLVGPTQTAMRKRQGENGNSNHAGLVMYKGEWRDPRNVPVEEI